MPKSCRAPNCSNTEGQLGADNRPVSFYAFPLKDGPRLQAWLRQMGCEHWVPNCHEHLCSEHFTPSCFHCLWGVRYLRPSAVPSLFSRIPPTQSLRSSGNPQKPEGPPPSPQGAPNPADPNAIHLVLQEPRPADSGTPTCPAPPTLEGQCQAVPTQFPLARLRAVLGALQRSVRSLQRRHARNQKQLRTLEQLAQQLCGQSLRARGQLRRLPRPKESRAVNVICGGADVAVILGQGHLPPTLDVKPELPDCKTTGA